MELTGVWGILQPEDIPSARRLQSLGLTRSIRHFNEMAVPGLGGLWFALPVIWSLIGIKVARRFERRPIEVANAVEALAMKMALHEGDGQTDPRVRGRRNLPRVGRAFEDLSKHGAYVVQPFRQGCTQPLFALGLVVGTKGRFNSFHLTDDGERLLKPLAAVCGKIEKWVGDGKLPRGSDLSDIVPTASLPKAIRAELTHSIYCKGAEAERRKAIRDVGGRLTSEDILGGCPDGLAQDHLIDMRGGIATVRLRDAAIRVLGAVESRIAKRRDDGQTPSLTIPAAGSDDEIRKLLDACIAEAGRVASHIEAAREPESVNFLRDCQTDDGLLQRLAKRDGVVIVLRDDLLVPGPAFGTVEVVGDEPNETTSGVPELRRIANLLDLTNDLSGTTARAFIGRGTE